jgi:hypothetical protein
LDGKELFTNEESKKNVCVSDFTYLNNFSVIDKSQNTFFLTEYKDIKLEDKQKLPLFNLISSNSNLYKFNTDFSGFEIDNTNITIYPIFLTDLNKSYTLSTFLNSDINCSLYINYPKYKIGILNDKVINNLLCYANIDKINLIDVTFKPINIYKNYSLIPIINNLYTLDTSDVNSVTFNLENK